MRIPSRLEEWTHATLQEMVESRVAENSRIEFKSGRVLFEPAGKETLAKAACALANAAGGFIVLGIDEAKGGWELAGLEPDREIAKRVNDRLKVFPSISYPPPHPVVVSEGRVCYVVEIPASPEGPHASIASGVPIFYERSPSGSVPMQWSGIRDRMMRFEERRTRVNLLIHELNQHLLVARDHRLNAASGQEISLEGFELSTARQLVQELFPLIAENIQLAQAISDALRAMQRVNSYMPLIAADLAGGRPGPSRELNRWRSWLATETGRVWDAIRRAQSLLGTQFNLKIDDPGSAP